jgi:hypothetical protein
VNPVTGQVAVAQPSWRGRFHDVRQDRQLLCSYVPQGSSAPSAAHQRLRGTPSSCRRAGGVPEAFCDHHHIRGVDRNQGPRGPGAPWSPRKMSKAARDATSGPAGRYGAPGAAVAAAVRCSAPSQVGVGAALLQPGERSAPPSGSSTMARRPTPGKPDHRRRARGMGWKWDKPWGAALSRGSAPCERSPRRRC